MNGQEFHLFRAGLDLVELSGQVLSEVLRVVLARRAYFDCSRGVDSGSSKPHPAARLASPMPATGASRR